SVCLIEEQARDGFFGGGAADRFADQVRDRKHADAGRGLHLRGRLNRIGDHQFLEIRFVDARDRAAREHAVGDVAVDGVGAFFQQRIGGLQERAAGIHDVVDQKTDAAVDIADDIGYFRLTRPLAPLVDDGEWRVDALGEPARAHHAADVGRYHRYLGEIETLLDVAHHDGRSE